MKIQKTSIMARSKVKMIVQKWMSLFPKTHLWTFDTANQRLIRTSFESDKKFF